jgi:hypothetical protein
MRPRHLKLAAASMLAVAAVMIMRHPSEPNPNGADPVSGHPLATQAVRRGYRAVSMSAPSTPLPAGQAVRQAPPTADTNPADISDTHSTIPDGPQDMGSTQAGRAIQLAENVRLPAAFMAQSEPEMAALTISTNAVAAANLAITDSFYQQLAAGVAAQPAPAAHPEANRSGMMPVTPTPGTEDTTVIPPGPEVASARESADELYRALFGDEAYGRMTLHSALEVRLPADAGSAP